MFLLTPELLFWDTLILVSLVGSAGLAVGCLMWLRITKHASKSFWRTLKRGLVFIIGFISLATAILIAYGSFVEPQIISVSDHQIKLATNQPLTIVVMSDFQVGPLKDKAFVERVVYKTNQLLPDLVLIAGDFVFNDKSDLSALEPLKYLRTTAGVYAVLGNHDQGFYRPPFKKEFKPNNISQQVEIALGKLNIEVLRNKHKTITLGTDHLTIIGVDDLWSGKSRLDLALPKEPVAGAKLLLVHNPSLVADPLVKDVDLILSGHTHGGQIRLPKVGPLTKLPITIGQQYDNGVFDLNSRQQLAITRGLGEGILRARLFTPPEIMVLKTK